MSGVLEAFAFQRRDSLLHRLDPRVKMFYAFAMIFLAGFVFSDVSPFPAPPGQNSWLIPLMALLLVQAFLALLGKVGRLWARTLRASVPLVLLIVGLNLLTLWWPTRTLSTGDIERVLVLAVRFLVFVTSFSIFTLTTSPDDLSLALEQMGIPYWFCFMFRAALRFTPVMAREARITLDAQRARGLELDKGNFITRAKRYVPVLVPLIVNAITRAWAMAEAMEARAWGAGRRTSLYVLRMSGRDYLALLIVMYGVIISIYVRTLVCFPSVTPYLASLLGGLF